MKDGVLPNSNSQNCLLQNLRLLVRKIDTCRASNQKLIWSRDCHLLTYPSTLLTTKHIETKGTIPIQWDKNGRPGILRSSCWFRPLKWTVYLLFCFHVMYWWTNQNQTCSSNSECPWFWFYLRRGKQKKPRHFVDDLQWLIVATVKSDRVHNLH